ncbi:MULTISPECIES: YdcF family protein [Bacillaceae]|uniref:YdcF family protein n=1 Tax=Bacillaceae TaxID=186817 RepID=UPI00080AE91A|nr:MULTISPECIES: YdcF family protein [Bacillaceae]OCA84801.1 cytoplasmic protein [Bacillus sp. FJAT-27986]
MKRILLISFTAIIIILLIYISILQFNMYRYANQEQEKTIDYIIVLGARVKGETPSLSLKYRIDAAADFLINHPKCMAILSGGQGDGEDISEAEAMKRGLEEYGIPSNRLILEDASTNTKENISFSKELIPSHLNSGAVVTNDYHLYRTIKIAEKLDLKLTGIPAKTPKISRLKSHVREYAAITSYRLKKDISW